MDPQVKALSVCYDDLRDASAGVVPPEPRPGIILFEEEAPLSVEIALKFVMAESMFGVRGRARLWYDKEDHTFVSYMRPDQSKLPTLDDIAEIWVVNNAGEEES